MSYSLNHKQKPAPAKKSLSRMVYIELAVVAIAAAGAIIWFGFIRDTGPKAVNGVIPATTPAENTPDEQPAETPTPATPTKTPTGDMPATNTTLDKAPEGSFVSNHKPSLSGTSVPSTEQSVCNTTPGASCHIAFTKDGVTRTLPSKQANADGFVIWNWDVKDAGLTEGKWDITAIATLNGQTKSTKDTIGLEVTP